MYISIRKVSYFGASGSPNPFETMRLPAKCRDLVLPCAAAGWGGTRYPGTRLPGTSLPGTRSWHKVAGTKLWRPATNTFHGHEQSYEMITAMQMIIISCVRGTSKTLKMRTALCISYDSEASRSPSRPLPKIMKMVTVLSICYDSPPTHFQRHANDDIPMHLL